MSVVRNVVWGMVIKQTGKRPDNDAMPVLDLVSDSLEFVELVAEIENHLNIEIPNSELGKIATVGDLIKVAEELYAKQTSTGTAVPSEDV